MTRAAQIFLTKYAASCSAIVPTVCELVGQRETRLRVLKISAKSLTQPSSDILPILKALASNEANTVLATLKARGQITAVLSNGSPDMLEGAVDFAGVQGWLDDVLSVEDVGVFKPARVVYDMVGKRFDVSPEEVLFVSSNGWDAAAAAAYGFHTVWVNRAGEPMDRLFAKPGHVLSDLTGIPDLAGSL